MVSGLCQLYSSELDIVTKVLNDLPYEIQMRDESTKGPIQIQMLRRYYRRTDIMDHP